MPIPGEKPAEPFDPPSYVPVGKTQNAHDFINRPVPAYHQCVPPPPAGAGVPSPENEKGQTRQCRVPVSVSARVRSQPFRSRCWLSAHPSVD
jgi:hypothetical protein